MSTEPTATTERGVIDGSVIVGVIRNSVAGSRVAKTLRHLLNQVSDRLSVPNSWLGTSTTVGTLASIERAARQSGLARAVNEAEAWTRGSFLYRWLTAEPDPEVVVIDLRETITARPFIETLDELLGIVGLGLPRSAVGKVVERTTTGIRAAPVRLASGVLVVAVVASLATTLVLGSPSTATVIGLVVLLGLAVIGLRVDATWDEVASSRAVEIVVAALEPPEPPERAGQRDEPSAERDAEGHGGTSEDRDAEDEGEADDP